jgi:hypothetical protein
MSLFSSNISRNKKKVEKWCNNLNLEQIKLQTKEELEKNKKQQEKNNKKIKNEIENDLEGGEEEEEDTSTIEDWLNFFKINATKYDKKSLGSIGFVVFKKEKKNFFYFKIDLVIILLNYVKLMKLKIKKFLMNLNWILKNYIY